MKVFVPDKRNACLVSTAPGFSECRAAQIQKTARPSGRHAQEVCIKTHGRFIVFTELDRDALRLARSIELERRGEDAHGFVGTGRRERVRPYDRLVARTPR